MVLPNSLERWKTVIHNLDRLHWGLMELKQSTGWMNPLATHTNLPVTNTMSWPAPAVISSPQTTDTPTPMDIGQHRPYIETCTCYNCNKPGHISPNCPEPRKQHMCRAITEVDIQDLIAKAVSATLDVWDKVEAETKEGVKGDF